MRRLNYCWFFLLIVSFDCFSVEPSSYYWEYALNGAHYDTADLACKGNFGSTYYAASGGDNAKGCYKTNVSGSYIGTVYRFGVCPSGTSWSNGTCEGEENPCSSKTGASSRFNRSGSGGDGYYEFSGNYGSPSQDGCFGGCTANTADQKCTSNLSTMTYSCLGTMYYTGAQCTTSPAPEVDETTDTSTPEPQAYSDYTPCQYTTNAQGVQVCVSSSSEGKEGQYCGTVNGVKTCIDAKPIHNGIEITTKVETTNNPDGSTTVVKTDTANTTKCSGFNCTTSTTTSTTTTSKNGSGETTSVTGSCTGPQCPDKNTNPDGDGDGFGDCIGDDCAGGGGAGVESPDLDEVPGYGDSLATYWGDIQDAPIVSAVTSITLPSGGTCPTYTATIEYVGTVSTAVACDLAVSLLTPLQYLFLAIWAFVAVRTTMTA